MKKMTLSFPKELKDKMDKRPEVNWNEVIVAGFKKKVEQLEKFQQLVNEGVI